MIGVYPFMLYPGVVLAHPELPDDQWSLLTPEGVFNNVETLSRVDYIAMWRNLPGGGVGYESRESGQGLVKYGFSLVPGDDSIDLELAITNCNDKMWKGVMTDICLMNIRAPHFYDAEYTRTYVIVPEGLARVADFMKSPARPVFRRAGHIRESLHFFSRERSSFWYMTDIELADNLVLTQSVDGEWTVAFGWEDLHMAACNSDTAHGCVHANPYLGDIAPGQANRVRGKIYIARQQPEEVVERFRTEMGAIHWSTRL